MGLQIRSDLFDNRVLGGKSINIVDNMQRLLTAKKAPKSDYPKEVSKPKTIVGKRLKLDGKMEALKKRRAEKRAAAVDEFWRAVLRERKMKAEDQRVEMEVEEEEIENEQERKERKEMRRKEWEEKEKELEEMARRRSEEQRKAAKEKMEVECEVIDVSDEEEVTVEEGNGCWFNVRTILLASQGERLKDDEVTKLENPDRMIDEELGTADAEALGGEKYSDHLGDAVKVICQLCNSCESLTAMRSHTRSKHEMSIAVYRERFGQLADHMEEKVFHKCKICHKILLLDSDIIYHHARRTHGLMFKEYTARYMTLKNKRKMK